MSQPMKISAIKTPLFHLRDSLADFIENAVDRSLVSERSVLAVTSKIVSLAEGRVVSAKNISKKDLIRQEADFWLGEIGYGATLTIKHGLMLPGAGIDESNSEYGDYILYPQDPFQTALDLRRELMKRWQLQEFGVLITDSRSAPLRQGTTGVGLSFAGFFPIKNQVGEKDLFGRSLKITKVNLVDSLAAAAVLMMGEAAESCPLALIENAPVQFTEVLERSSLETLPDQDMYLPLYKHLLK